MKIKVSDINAAGTRDTTTFLRGDGTFDVPPGGGGGGGGGTGGYVGAKAYRNGTQSVANSTVVLASFDTNVYDEGGVHSTSVNPTRFTASQTGKWLVSYHVRWGSNSTGVRYAWLIKNGGATVVGSRTIVTPNTSDVATGYAIEVDLAVGDYVELVVYQTSGSTLTMGDTFAGDPGSVISMSMSLINSFSSGGGTGSAFTAHKFWRLHIPYAEGQNFAYSIAECEMRATVGGANQCSGGTATAKSGTNPSFAFNGNPADWWEDAYGSSLATRGSWLRYEFVSPVIVREILLQARTGAGNQLPRFLNIQFSDDGNNWTTAWSQAIETAANGAVYLTANPMANNDLSLYQDKRSLNGLNTITIPVPAGYSNLRLVINGATLQAALQDNPLVRVNGLSTGIYSIQRSYLFNTTGVADQSLGATSWGALLAGLPGTTAPANSAGFNDLEIFDYGNTTFRKVGKFSGRQPFSTGNTDSYYMSGVIEADVTAAISSITVSTTSGANFKNGSTVELILSA